MFTGIIEEIGIVQEIKTGEKTSKIVIKATNVIKETKLGDSISTNGVCLTVSDISSERFEADVMAETLRRSNLGNLSIGDKVNLERAIRVDGRFGGHIVSGHIDGTGKIISIIKDGNATWITMKTTTELLKYIVEKGSVAIDGISLTVAYVDMEEFKVSIIPHTSKETILLGKKVGSTVNIECDVIGKYVEKLLGFKEVNKNKKSSLITEDFLVSNGFL
ncbi:MAG: riboflavin synthase [Clostridium sp.]